MSTTTSPPPRSGVTGFNNQTSYDPYLPLSEDDEQLTQVSTSNTPSSSHQEANLNTSGQHLTAGSTSGTGESPFSDYTAHASNGMSPYESFPPLAYEEENFDNNLLLEGMYGELPAPENPVDGVFPIPFGAGPTSASTQEEPPSATTNHTSSAFSRQSTGLADLSGNIPSPVLTDDMNSPEPGDVHMSKNLLASLGGGPMSRLSSQSTAVEGAQYYGPDGSLSHPTPAPTGSSVHVSPDPNAAGNHRFSTQAPSFRFESYTRGDSPARAQGGLKRSRAGSRSSSHLAAPESESDADPEEDPQPAVHRTGLDPSGREEIQDSETRNVQDIEADQALESKSKHIGHWLSTSAAENEAPPAGLEVPAEFLSRRSAKTRIRSKSSSNPRDLPQDAAFFSSGLRASTNAALLGPNTLIDEDSDEEDDSSDETESQGSSAEPAPPSITMRTEQEEQLDKFPVFEEPTAHEASPWADPIYFPSRQDSIGQPQTANAAMVRFMKRSRDIETASRVATWGTQKRRMSDGDMQRIFGPGGLLARLSISKERDDVEKEEDDNWQQFKETVEQAAAKLLPKRTLSSSKRKQSNSQRPGARDPQSPEHNRKESTSSSRKGSQAQHGRHDSSASTSIIDRIPSVRRRPKSPGINTNVATGLAGALPIGSLGIQGQKSPSISSPPTSTWEKFKGGVRETLSRHASQDSPEILNYRPSSAAQSKTSLTSPPIEARTSVPVQQIDEDADGDSDDIAPDDLKGVKMDMKPSEAKIIPNFEGFKSNARDVNPRLDNWLVERLGQEQLRRYKKLVNFKVEHAKAKENNNCSSGAQCRAKGAEPIYHAPKPQKEPEHSHTGFSMTAVDGDEDAEAVADGIVTEAQFPPGLPMPPAKRLPAEFECPFCFQVKKFTKPSDWSKHVHEDLQPFTCTFKNCPDPKSFKRKADWVRHENERHRQLEWWQCTEEGCSHLCYRRDNFVQHLVREHKLPEPKSKNPKSNNNKNVRGPAKNKVKIKGDIRSIAPEDKVLYMVDACRHETPKNAMNEPCRFCGNHLNSFKKLTVHLARHMETLSLPVLALVDQKDVSPDTIISPVDVKLSSISPVDHNPYNDPFPPSTVIPGFTPVTDSTFSSNYTAQGNWVANGQQMATQGNSNYTTSMNNWGMPASGMYSNSGQQQFHAMGMHHNSVPNSSMYNMSSQGQSMQDPYAVAESSYAQRPHFHTPQYIEQAAQQDNMMGIQYDGRGGQAYTQAPTTGTMYSNERVQRARRSPQQPQQGFYNY